MIPPETDKDGTDAQPRETTNQHEKDEHLSQPMTAPQPPHSTTSTACAQPDTGKQTPSKKITTVAEINLCENIFI